MLMARPVAWKASFVALARAGWRPPCPPRSRAAVNLVGLLATSGLVASLAGCSATSCDQHDTVTPIHSGTTYPDMLAYVSARGDAMDRFGAGEALDFYHGLGVTPQSIQSFVSFSSNSSAAENAGSQGNIECADHERVRLRNGTCQDFYVRVVIQAFGDGDPGARPCD